MLETTIVILTIVLMVLLYIFLTRYMGYDDVLVVKNKSTDNNSKVVVEEKAKVEYTHEVKELIKEIDSILLKVQNFFFESRANDLFSSTDTLRKQFLDDVSKNMEVVILLKKFQNNDTTLWRKIAQQSSKWETNRFWIETEQEHLNMLNKLKTTIDSLCN